MNFIIRLSGPARRHFLPFLFVLPRSSTWFGVPSTRLCGSHPIDLPLLLVDLRMSSIVRDECVEDGQRCILLKKLLSLFFCLSATFPAEKKGAGPTLFFVCVFRNSPVSKVFLCALCCVVVVLKLPSIESGSALVWCSQKPTKVKVELVLVLKFICYRLAFDTS